MAKLKCTWGMFSSTTIAGAFCSGSVFFSGGPASIRACKSPRFLSSSGVSHKLIIIQDIGDNKYKITESFFKYWQNIWWQKYIWNWLWKESEKARSQINCWRFIMPKVIAKNTKQLTGFKDYLELRTNISIRILGINIE